MSYFAAPISAQIAPPNDCSWTLYSIRDGLPSDDIRSILVTADCVWVGTQVGLARWDRERGDRWTTYNTPSDLSISAIDIDPRSHDLWLGTWGGGLVRFSAGRFDRFNQFNSGLAGDIVFAVVVAGRQVWVATNAGLCCFDPVREEWEIFGERRNDAPETVCTSLHASGEFLYALGWCEGLRRINMADRRWSAVAQPSPRRTDRENTPGPLGIATLVASSDEGSIYWVTPTQLNRLDGNGEGESRRTPQFLQGTYFNCMAVSAEHGIWLGTPHGVRVLPTWTDDTWYAMQRSSDGRSLIPLTIREGTDAVNDSNKGESSDPIRAMAFNCDAIWIATNAGLLRGTFTKQASVTVRPTVAEADSPSPPLGDEPSRPKPLMNGEPAFVDGSPRSIGLFGPTTRLIALPGPAKSQSATWPSADFPAVQRAVAQFNTSTHRSGIEGIGLVLGHDGYDRYGWRTREDDLIVFSRQAGVRGVVGVLGPESRIASSVIAGSELPFVNAGATPATLDEIINPWIFRCPVADKRYHECLMDCILDSVPDVRLAIIRTPGALSRMHLDWWLARARTRNKTPVVDVTVKPDLADLGPVVHDVRARQVNIVLTWADAGVSARILSQLRHEGMDALFVGSDEIVTATFVQLASPAPGQVVAPFPCRHRIHGDADAGGRMDRVSSIATKIVNSRNDPMPDLSFIGTLHLLEAVDAAGSDRDAVRRRLQEMSEPVLARLVNGDWERQNLPENSPRTALGKHAIPNRQAAAHDTTSSSDAPCGPSASLR